MPSSKTSAHQNILPSYPPQTHSSVSRKNNIIAEQPSPAQNMSLRNPQPRGQAEEQAARLRGGCIPCPDGGCCFIIPCPCC